MISPEEIKQQALKWWPFFLRSHILNEPFFPRSIDRIGKVQSGDITHRYEALKQEIEYLYQFSKNETGTGYLVKTEDKNFRRTGSHELPDSIVFETADDYIHYVGKKKEWKLFRQNYELITHEIPTLKDWSLHNTAWLTQPQIQWRDVLKVCKYFIATPRPDLYIRQLPVEIHTKFIEENSALTQSLLDFLIPGNIRDICQKKFAERYFLKYDEPLVRIRILDAQVCILHKIADISIPLHDFEQTDWQIENVLIAENKMNFLTLPSLLSAIAVWSGGGFNVSYLKNAGWLHTKKIFYWGDIDEHGFQMLHQLRSYFPQTKSLLMDRQTFDSFQPYVVNGARNKSENLHLLNQDETALYQYLKSLESKNRLEQEKIPQSYVDSILSVLLRHDN